MDVTAAKMLGAGIAMIGVIGAGIGIGNIFSSLIEAIGRNPSARDQVFMPAILGFALVEAVALYALLIAILLMYT
jgi:F-type H+-transporting ATPase subunit c